MAYSTQRVTSDGTLSVLAISIKYFERTEISVLFNGLLATSGWSWVGSNDKVLQFVPDVPAGVEVTVVRKTDLAEMRHRFSLGAAFKAANVDEDFNQILHVAQESQERPTYTDLYNDLNLHGYKLTGLADGVNPTDSVNMQQHTAQAAVVQEMIDETAANISTITAAVASIDNVVDTAGNLYVTNDLKFTGVNAKITGAFAGNPLLIQGDTGLATNVYIAPPTGGTQTTLVLGKNVEPGASTGNMTLQMGGNIARVYTQVNNPDNAHPALDLSSGDIYLELVCDADVGLPRGIHMLGAFADSKPRVYGRYSDTPLEYRLLHCTSDINWPTDFGVIPNGTAVSSSFTAYNANDPTNASSVSLMAGAVTNSVKSGKAGTGTYKPLALNVGGIDVVTVKEDGTGTVTIAGTAPRITGDLSNATVGNRLMAQTSTANSATSFGIMPSGTSVIANFAAWGGIDPDNAPYVSLGVTATQVKLIAGKTGTGVYKPLSLYVNGADQFQLDLSGNSLHINPAGGLGYGAGAGGSVTQTTSKTTGVTLSKPCGQITTFNTAMLSNTKARFTFTNSLIATTDGPRFWIVGPTASAYRVWCDGVAGGACGVILENYSGVSLSENVVIGFSLGKAVTA